MSYVVAGRQRFTLQQAVAECGAALIGDRIWRKYKKWPVYSKFFDNMGPIPHHMHQNAKQAALLGLEGKPESYYFPPQHNNVGNNFPYTFMGLEPGTTKARRAPLPGKLEQGRQRHPGPEPRLPPQARHRLADSARAFCTRPARSAPTSRNGAAMFSACINRWSKAAKCPGRCWSRTCPKNITTTSIIWSSNSIGKATPTNISRTTITWSRSRSPARASEGCMDRWIVYGKVDGEQLFTAKELTLEPGAKCTIKDNGAYGLITVQGKGR